MNQQWFSVPQAAALTGHPASFLYRQIKHGQRTPMPDGSIAPVYVKRIGDMLHIRRDWIYPDEPTNVVPFRTDSDEHQIQLLQTALERFAAEFLAQFADRAMRSRKAG